MKRRFGLGFLLAGILFFGISYSWTHAALAHVANPSKCPVKLTSEAKKRTFGLFGTVTSSPVFTCIKNPVLGMNVTYGTSRFSPGFPAIIVLGPEGLNIDVASHEYAHTELAERSSVLKRTYRIPTWFDEGLAMQVDYREEFSIEALATYGRDQDLDDLFLEKISSPNLFFRTDERGRAHYAFARCVVGLWLKDGDSIRLNELVSNVAWTTNFPVHQFTKHEDQCRSFIAPIAPQT